MNPFDYINAISFTKKDIMIDELAEKDYNSFIVNKGLSYFLDTCLFANEMNMNAGLPKRLQFDFYINTDGIRPKRRFSKWHKKEKNDDLAMIQEFFNFSIKKAEIALKILTKEQLKQIKNSLIKGG